MSYAQYHAEDWATNKTRHEIEQEIERLNVPHNFQWNEVGNAALRHERIEVLTAILAKT